MEPSRRKTRGEDSGERVPPQLVPGRAPRAAGPMTIDVRLADAGQTFRPLPRLPIPPIPKSAPPAPSKDFPHSPKRLWCPPAPKSAPPVPPKEFPRGPSPRPLPSPPLSAVICSTPPATPLSPIMPAFRANTRSGARSLPPGFSSLKVQTSLDACAFEAQSPASPEPPTPRTAQRKRINKLRRHLGESVQVVFDRPDKVDVLAGLRRAGSGGDACPVINVAVESVLDSRSSTDSDTSSECESDDKGNYSLRAPRASRKWMRERGKARWTEDDFTKVLQDLRAL
ncbi:hypothetical protein C8R45DRAFT_218133 [Mycena sanguinolenta]|nr:hypothetical protein C8R45DRAFT_218133 [Mycena sanguinolenta]